MRYLLLILLGLSLPAIAEQAGQQQGQQVSPPSSTVVVTPPCDPKEELTLPDFN
ncbi:MAG: hypothetical protein HYX35_05460 [Proteobacteria bacterium]|nr:hypothetical protein [Pseudomonadota bacterium]